MSDPVHSRRGGGREAKRAARLGAVATFAPFIERKLPYVDLLGEEGLSLIEANAETILTEIGVEFRDDPSVPDRSGNRDTRSPQFSRRTRRYLRRRAFRYFRVLARGDSQRYGKAIRGALVLYRDQHLDKPERLLDAWGLMHALYWGSEVLSRDPKGIRLAKGRSMAELEPAPMSRPLCRSERAHGSEDDDQHSDRHQECDRPTRRVDWALLSTTAPTHHGVAPSISSARWAQQAVSPPRSWRPTSAG